jgi:nucleotide-binding universal stress UspA family protein
VAGTGSLRTYLGTAPGVGKTFAMLAEGRRRAEAGDKVVVGWLEPQDRAGTSLLADGLDVLPPRSVAYRGAEFADFDVPAAIASGADVVLVDELAHATPDRSRQRWEDVAEVLAAGLDVITTANVAHLRSVRDYAARIAGVGPTACVPDEFVRAGEVVLVDLPPQALRARIAAGAVYSAPQVGGALADYFRVANLEALSELAQAWLAGTAEAVGEDLLVRRGLAEPPSSALVIAGDSGSRWGEAVIHRAAELARADDAGLLVVHVEVGDGVTRSPAQDLARHRELTAELGGTYANLSGRAVAQALADTARAQGAATVVVGRHRSWLAELAHGSVSARLRRLLPAAAVEEVSHPLLGAQREGGPGPGRPGRRAGQADRADDHGQGLRLPAHPGKPARASRWWPKPRTAPGPWPWPGSSARTCARSTSACPAWTASRSPPRASSRTANSTSPAASPGAAPTPRSPPSTSSRSARSRPTSPASRPSSGSATVSRSPPGPGNTASYPAEARSATDRSESLDFLAERTVARQSGPSFSPPGPTRPSRIRSRSRSNWGVRSAAGGPPWAMAAANRG